MINFYAKLFSGVYAIRIDGRTVYIGQSQNLHTRALQHQNYIIKGDGAKGLWYPLAKEFLERGHNITFSVLEKVDKYQLESREKELIEKYRPLFNTHLNQNKFSTSLDYEEAIKILKLKPRPYVGLEKIKNEDRALRKGWFGEAYL